MQATRCDQARRQKSLRRGAADRRDTDHKEPVTWTRTRYRKSSPRDGTVVRRTTWTTSHSRRLARLSVAVRVLRHQREGPARKENPLVDEGDEPDRLPTTAVVLPATGEVIGLHAFLASTTRSASSATWGSYPGDVCDRAMGASRSSRCLRPCSEAACGRSASTSPPPTPGRPLL